MANDLAGTPAVTFDVGEYVFDLLPVGRASRKKLQAGTRVAHHRAQRLIELVRHRTRQRTRHCGTAEMCELVPLLLELNQRPSPLIVLAFAIGDVGRRADQAVARHDRLAASQEPADVAVLVQHPILKLEARRNALRVVARGATKLRQVFLVDERRPVGSGLAAARIESEPKEITELGLDDQLLGLDVPLPDTDLARDARELEPMSRSGER